MNTHTDKARKTVALCLALAAVTCVGVAAAARQRASARLPKVVSKVKSLEIVSVTIQGEGGPTSPSVVVEVYNNSDRGIVAMFMESGDDKDMAGLGVSGFTQDPPTVVLEPYGKRTMSMSLNSLFPGKPFRISGVMYYDGEVEGEEPAKQRLRAYKERPYYKEHPNKPEKNDPPR
jgi:hypothetical protein